MAGATGLEPAIFGLTGRYVNRLHHAPKVRVTQCVTKLAGRDSNPDKQNQNLLSYH